MLCFALKFLIFYNYCIYISSLVSIFEIFIYNENIFFLLSNAGLKWIILDIENVHNKPYKIRIKLL
jgi:hypothetical protein